ncbi:MAG: sugar ABC transporter permease [Oscillospiraceae bacterium]|nr:sugar ABC transporter permease [Oscillospiraceae bacterium]
MAFNFKRYKRRRTIVNSFVYLFLGTTGVVWVMPLFYMIVHSFRLNGSAKVSDLWPNTWTFDNYIKLLTDTSQSVNFPRFFLNTLVVAIFSCVISTLVVLMVSYAFSRLRFKTRKKFINIGMVIAMFPGFMSMIAIFMLLDIMGLLKTLLALIVCYSAGAGLGYQISKGFFDTIPRALDEAATIDGATRNQVFWKIILPMSKPIIVYTVLTSFIGPWCDFIFVKIVMLDEVQNYTVSVGLQQMISVDYISEWYKPFLAGSVLVALPITLLFLKLQTYYVSGVTAGGVKG